MRTTVTLDESLVTELLKYTDSKTKTAAVAQAVKEQIRLSSKSVIWKTRSFK